MKPVVPELKALLEGWITDPTLAITMLDLFTFTLPGGETFRYSGGQIDLSTYLPNQSVDTVYFEMGPPIQRSRVKTQIGVEVDEMEVDVFADKDDQLGINSTSITWHEAAWKGLFDGAHCELDRAFLPRSSMQTANSFAAIHWPTVCLFYGRIGDVEIGRSKITFKVKSELDRLTIQMPRRLYQASCGFIFGDARCLFDRESRSADVTAEGGTTSDVIYSSLSASPSTLYDNGTVISTSGYNNGFARSISRFTDGKIHFLKPWIFPSGPGETFHLLPGCDHTLDTCKNVFNNDIHFGGFPYIPPPEVAV